MLAASDEGAYGLNLLPQHEALLRDSAVAPGVARARGYWSATKKAEVEKLGFKGGQANVPALVIPIHEARGERALHQLRPDAPRVIEQGKVIKYETPARRQLIIDVPPGIGARLRDTSVPLFITEGARKSDAAVSAGLCSIALLGVWGWCRKDAKGKRRPLPDWASIPLDGREVVIVFDSDVMAKPEVHKALVALKQLLEARGARVSIAYLPPGDGDAKVGLDDYLAAGHTVEELRALATTELRRPKALPALTPAIVTSGGTPSAALFFDGEGHFIPARLGAWLMREAPVQLGHDRQLWRYEGGVYRAGGDDWAKQRTRQIVGERFRRNHLEEVNAWLRARIPSLGHAPPREFINCANGLLDWKTGVLHDHSPDVLTTNQIPVDWTPGAKAPTVERFLREIVPDDCVELVEELAGYALYAGNPFRKAVILYGKGGNGKSTLLRLFTAPLGETNVSDVPLQALSEDRFSAADIFGKLANICGDLDARDIHRTDLFKQVTGGDPIRAQLKYRDAFSFTSYALPLFSANELPRTQDQTDAWFDRWIR